MEPISDTAPGHSLPAIKSSTLQVAVRKTARAATVHASAAFDPEPARPIHAPVRLEETTLGALAARIGAEPVDENVFDPAAYLRRTSAQIPRSTGAGLAGAALKHLGKR